MIKKHVNPVTALTWSATETCIWKEIINNEVKYTVMYVKKANMNIIEFRNDKMGI